MAKKVILRKRTLAKPKDDAGTERHYFDDPKFHAELSAYQIACNEAKAAGLPKPVVSDYIIHALMLLSRKIARKTGFSRYPFIEDMVGDAILCCFKNLHNFKPQYPKAFGYFTKIVHYSFIQRITKEKTALYRKYRAIIERQKELCGQPGAEGSQVYGTAHTDLKMREYIVKFEKRLAEKRQKSKDRKKAAPSKIQFDEDIAADVELFEKEAALKVEEK